MKPSVTSKVRPVETLSLCVNANFMAETLEEFAQIKMDMAEGRTPFFTTNTRWVMRIKRWSEIEAEAAKVIEELVAEIERLRSGGKPT